MDLKTYLAQRRGLAGELAGKVGCTAVFLRNVAAGHRAVSETLALAIERVTQGEVSVADLRPELAEALRRGGYSRVDLCAGPPNPVHDQQEAA